MKRWIVTCVDWGETCDGKARTLGVFKEREEARALVRNDIEHWADQNAGENIQVDFDKMNVYHMSGIDPNAYGAGCEWNIEEVEIPL